MKILMVASEGAPYAKTGGLADVIGALPASLASKGHEVAVVMPLYRSAERMVAHADRVFDRMPIRLNPARTYLASFRRLKDRGVQIFFVDVPELYDRPELYGEAGQDYPDNPVRFAVLCRAALGVIRSLFRPDLVHCHDWQSGLVGAYMRHTFRHDPTYTGIATLMTIHNLGYQGQFGRAVLGEVGLDRELFVPSRLEFWGGVNFLKAGIVYADGVSTVSRGYAKEIQTPEYGFGLDGLLRSRAAQVTGIVNGVDYLEWSPETDPFIAAQYSAADLTGKVECKRDLLRTFGLSQDDLKRPVIGIVSRFASQKGFDLIEQIASQLLQGDVALTVLGTGEPHYESVMRSLAEQFPDKVAVRVQFSNELAHKVEAGADIFLMPSRYEPCGLNQIYSLRYGTVPVVRATGGLDDTIDENVGFKFSGYTGSALMEALESALETYKNKELWSTLMKNGMLRDHSWGVAADQYVQIYKSLFPTV
ncbi:MAG: glycogen synthase GlgA [Bryobacteraceae bacterium]|nr:glycogen synthase GlgA [Bryobacteraceae bacterium]